MSLMKENPMESKTGKRPPAGASDDGRKRQKPEPLRQTRRRIRKIVERHRETFDKLAE